MNSLTVKTANLADIASLRGLFLQENNFQIRHHACHEQNWASSYLIFIDELAIGYGSVKGKKHLEDRDTIFEFYLLPPYRQLSEHCFRALIRFTQVRYIESQSNIKLLSAMLYTFGSSISSNTHLFSDDYTSKLPSTNLQFKLRSEKDDLFGRRREDTGDYVLDRSGEVVATGSFLLNYNPPFADIFIEVKESCWGQGLGSFIFQELKHECYLAGRVPAARCAIGNKASKSALQKAGMKVCGNMLMGSVSR